MFKKKKSKLEEKKSKAEKVLGIPGKLISWSKSGYRNNNPKNLVIFNAVLKDKDNKEIWSGDMDVTLEEEKLMELAKLLGEKIYVYPESSRFNKNESFAYSTDGTDFEMGTFYTDYKKIHNILTYDRK